VELRGQLRLPLPYLWAKTYHQESASGEHAERTAY
jgi:hypothetical protein